MSDFENEVHMSSSAEGYLRTYSAAESERRTTMRVTAFVYSSKAKKDQDQETEEGGGRRG